MNGHIPIATQRTIEKRSRWMQQKRYSTSTISTYLSFVRQFFGRTGLEPGEVTIEVIEQYNYRYFINVKRSYASQNQWINAVTIHDIRSEEHLIYIRGAKSRKTGGYPCRSVKIAV